MKTKATHFNTFILLVGMLFSMAMPLHSQVNGEILADTNNLTVVKVWGTHAERGYAHGYLLGEKITDIMQNYLIPRFGSDYPYARNLVTNGQDLIIDSLYQVEAKAMIEGMNDGGSNTYALDYVDLLVASCFSDLGGYISKKAGGPGCSCLLDWGDATSGSFLAGKSIAARFYDWGIIIPAIVNNAAMIIHVPSEPGLQPWLIVGYAGEMVPSGGGVSQGGLSMYKDAMSDYSGSAIPGSGYAPYQFTMRKILETNDFNSDGLHNTMDAKDGFDANSQGYPVGKIIPVIARWDPESDSNTAMVVEIASTAPTHTYRFSSYEDDIPSDNLYAANSQIARNNARNYCPRYINVAANMGDGTGIGIQKNHDLMVNHSWNPTSKNYGFIQHIPELDLLKVSVLRDGKNAYELPMTSFDLRDFFNRPPSFESVPNEDAYTGEEYVYEITVSDPDPYDEIVITAEQLPDWLTLVDNGDGTALLSGTPDELDVVTIILNASDGMENELQEFQLSIVTDITIETLDAKFKIYPNPFKSAIHLGLGFESAESCTISIYNNAGLILKRYELSGSHTGQREITLNLGDLPKGVYFIRLEVENEKVVKRVVKF